MEITKGIHHFDCGPFNWYLIEENGRFTIVEQVLQGYIKMDSIRYLAYVLFASHILEKQINTNE